MPASSESIIDAVELPATLLVTNDYPPRVGGIQRTLEALVGEFPPNRVAVFAPAFEGSDEFDRAAPYRVLRQPQGFLYPTRDVAARILSAIADTGAEVVLFGASYPLALLGPRIASSGTPYLAAAHGFEYWLSLVPGAHALLHHATSKASHVPVMCSEFIARRVRTAVPAGVPVSVMYPGADVVRFHPALPTDGVRERHHLESRSLVVCISRLVPRKGQDVLIDALPRIRRRVPDATLVLVGRGTYRDELERRASAMPPGSVVFAGEVAEAELPNYYAAADVFAMPCRSRLGGLEVEGWGNVFIEAAACGRAVVAGDSGGAREAIVDGETGRLVDGTVVEDVAEAVGGLLEDRELARKMGAAGRERVERSFTWARAAGELGSWLRAAT